MNLEPQGAARSLLRTANAGGRASASGLPQIVAAHRDPKNAAPLQQRSDEHFDAVMERALAHSQAETPDDSKTPVKPPRSKGNSDRARKTDLNGPAALPQCAADESPPAQDSTPTKSAQVVAPAVPAAQTAASQTMSSATGPLDAGSKSVGDILPGAEASTGSAPQKLAETPGNPLPVNGASALEADVQQKVQALSANVRPEPALPPESDPSAAAAGGIKPAGEGDNLAETNDSTSSPPLLFDAPGPDGISAAQHPVGMKKAEEKTEKTVLAEQNLPAVRANVAVETLPAGLARPVKIKFMSRQEGSVPPTAAGAGASPMSGTASAPEMTSTTAAAALEGLATTSARSLERTQDLMSLHALQLRASGADSLQVVIKPGPGMQLSLNLQMREGNVEMSATAPRGDFDALNRHWSELQQQLETRGVRLGSLTCSDQPASGDSHSFQQPQRQQADDNTPPAPAFADFALLGSMSLAPTIKTLSQRGWESWA